MCGRGPAGGCHRDYGGLAVRTVLWILRVVVLSLVATLLSPGGQGVQFAYAATSASSENPQTSFGSLAARCFENASGIDAFLQNDAWEKITAAVQQDGVTIGNIEVPGYSSSSRVFPVPAGQHSYRLVASNGAVLDEMTASSGPCAGEGLYVPTTPTRVVPRASLGPGEMRTFTLPEVPDGATSVALNVTVTDVTGNTFVSVCPGATARATCKASSVINSMQVTIANYVIVKLGGANNDQVSFVNSAGTTTVIADLNGWVVPVDFAAPSVPSGVYEPVVPQRVISSLSVTQNSLVTVTLESVPIGAVAVALNLTVAGVNPVAEHYISACPGSTSLSQCSQSSIINSYGSPVANYAMVKLGGPNRDQISFYNSRSTATLIGDLHGWVIDRDGTEAAPSEESGNYLPTNPNRVMDTSLAGGTLYTHTLQNVPVGATAVALNVTVASVSGNMWLSACPGGTALATCRTTSLINSNQRDVANYAIVKLGGPNRNQVSFYVSAGSARVIADLNGWVTRPAVVPAAPGQPTAVAGDGSATVNWTAPTDDGGAPISRYTVVATPGGSSITVGNQTSASFTGLNNYTPYTFTVTAINAAGRSTPSPYSAAVTPRISGPPQAPVILDVLARDGELRVHWAAPVAGGSDIAQYTVVTTPGGSPVSVAGDKSEVTLPGLTNGIPYAVTVSASNASGMGPASVPSPAVAPRPAEVPMAPVLTSALAFNGRVELRWVAPHDGGAAITGYQVTVSPSGQTLQIPAGTTSAVVTGLVNGQSSLFEITATNKIGRSTAMTTSQVPVATRVPAAPTDLQASVLATGTVRLTWSPPQDTGTSAVTGYQVTRNPGNVALSTSSTAIDVAGLDSAVEYTFAVAAQSAVGASDKITMKSSIRPVLAMKLTPVILAASSRAAMRAVHSDGSIEFVAAPDQIRNLQAGAVIVSEPTPAAPNGLLAKVVSVATSSGMTSVRTKEVPLSDILSEGGLVVDQVLTSFDVANFTAAAPGVRLKRPTLDGRPVTAESGRYGAHGLSLGSRDGTIVIEYEKNLGPVGYHAGQIAGIAKVTPHYEHDLQFSDSGMSGDLSISSDVDATFRVRDGVGQEWKQEWKLGELDGRCFYVWMGAFPLWLCPEMTFSMTLDARVTGGVSVTLNYKATVGAKVSKRPGEADPTAIPVFIPGNHEAADIRFFGAASAKASLNATGVVHLYNIAGPAVEIGPYLQVKAANDSNPFAEVRLGFVVTVRLQGNKDWKIKSDIWKKVVLDTWFSVWNSGGPFNGLTISPGSTQTGAGTVVDFNYQLARLPASTPVTWAVDEGPGSIDQTGAFVSTTEGIAIIRASTPASAGYPDTSAFATVRIGPEYPGTPTGVSVTPGQLAVDVAWAPPLPSSGGVVHSYTVMTVPSAAGARVLPSTARAARLTGLKAGVPYQIQIIANGSGGSSLPATSELFWVTDAPGPIGGPDNLSLDANGIADISTAIHGGVAMSADGRYVFHATNSNSNVSPIAESASSTPLLVRLDRSTGQRVVATTSLSGQPTFPGEGNYDVSDAGDVIAYASGPRHETVNIRTISTGAVRDLQLNLPTDRTVFQVRISGSGNAVVAATVANGTGGAAFRLQKWDAASNLWTDLPCPAPANYSCHVLPTDIEISADGRSVVGVSFNSLVLSAGAPPNQNDTDLILWRDGTITNLTQSQASPSCVDCLTTNDSPQLSRDGSTLAWQRRANRGGGGSGVVVASPVSGLRDAPVRWTEGEFEELRPIDMDADGSTVLLSREVGRDPSTRTTELQVADRASKAVSQLDGPHARANTGFEDRRVAISRNGSYVVYVQDTGSPIVLGQRVS